MWLESRLVTKPIRERHVIVGQTIVVAVEYSGTNTKYLKNILV